MIMDYYKQKVDNFQTIFNSIKAIKQQLINLKGRENRLDRDAKENELDSCYDQLLNNASSSIAFIQMRNQDLDFADEFRSHWAKKLDKNISLDGINSFDIIPTINDSYISSLPKYSFAIQFNFKLATPYISKDDNDFYVIENPV